jgi:hypothetical protein
MICFTQHERLNKEDHKTRTGIEPASSDDRQGRMRFTPLSLVSCIIDEMVLYDLLLSFLCVHCDVIASSPLFRCVQAWE